MKEVRSMHFISQRRGECNDDKPQRRCSQFALPIKYDFRKKTIFAKSEHTLLKCVWIQVEINSNLSPFNRKEAMGSFHVSFNETIEVVS